MKNILKYAFFLLLVSCSQTDNNIFEDITVRGGFVSFNEAPNLLHDILGTDETILSTTIVDPNNNAINYGVAILKGDGTLTDVIANVTSFPGELTITRQMVLDALELTDVSELPAGVRFVGIVTTPSGVFKGTAPGFDTTTNIETGGNTTSNLLAISPSAMNFNVVMYQLARPNEIVSFFVSSNDDDVEETLALNGQGGVLGEMDLSSSDLEFGEISSGQGLMGVGLRFNYVGLPAGATITSAKIQFSVDNPGSNAVEVTVYGEKSGNASAFTTSNKDLSTRTLTSASKVWNIATWVAEGDRGAAQQTVDISSVIQEIIDRPDWIPGNSINIIIKPSGDSLNATSSSGGREADTYAESAASAPELILSYTN